MVSGIHPISLVQKDLWTDTFAVNTLDPKIKNTVLNYSAEQTLKRFYPTVQAIIKDNVKIILETKDALDPLEKERTEVQAKDGTSFKHNQPKKALVPVKEGILVGRIDLVLAI